VASLSIVAAVGTVSVVVAVPGELLFRAGWAGVPAMSRRSAIAGWGLIIAVVVWAVVAHSPGGRASSRVNTPGAVTNATLHRSVDARPNRSARRL